MRRQADGDRMNPASDTMFNWGLIGPGGIAHRFADEIIMGQPESDVERTNASGKASSVHFIHFPFNPAQSQRFRVPDTRVVVGIGHPAYGHMAIMPESTRAELAADFD